MGDHYRLKSHLKTVSGRITKTRRSHILLTLKWSKEFPMKKVTRFLKRLFLWLLAIVFVLVMSGMIYQTASAEADRKNFPAPGNLIDVGGFKMHIHCMGEGSPTVILETLSGGTSSHWGWVQPEVAKTTRVCVYDRAGRGWSEPDSEPITLGRTVRNLHTLLTNAGVEGPYVLVGHSIGGIYVRQFAADYPDEVVGIVLVDAAHPYQYERYPGMREVNENYRQLSSAFPTLARLGLFRLYFASGGEIDFADMKEPQKSEIRIMWSSPEYFDSQHAEGIAAPEIYSGGQKLGRLGDLRLLVITAGQGASDGWPELQGELASLSDNSTHLTLEAATHVSLAFHPRDAHQVSMGILNILDAIRTGERLAD
jgi:pimeloyl-ACP methyl ester carboxylesterase